MGAGRTEVCQSIFGIMTPDSGTIELEGKQVSIKNPIDAYNWELDFAGRQADTGTDQ